MTHRPAVVATTTVTDDLADLAAQVEPVAAQFAQSHRIDFADPWAVRERCAEVSEEFADACRRAGLAAVVVSGGEFGEVPQFPGVRLLLNGHFATLIEHADPADTADGGDDGGGLVYDWTARQFDPDCLVPWVGTLAAWRTRWQPLSAR